MSETKGKPMKNYWKQFWNARESAKQEKAAARIQTLVQASRERFKAEESWPEPEENSLFLDNSSTNYRNRFFALIDTLSSFHSSVGIGDVLSERSNQSEVLLNSYSIVQQQIQDEQDYLEEWIRAAPVAWLNDFLEIFSASATQTEFSNHDMESLNEYGHSILAAWSRQDPEYWFHSVGEHLNENSMDLILASLSSGIEPELIERMVEHLWPQVQNFNDEQLQLFIAAVSCTKFQFSRPKYIELGSVVRQDMDKSCAYLAKFLSV